MKTRFSTYDLICSVSELQQLVGMRVNQIYDVDSKTYLIRLQSTEKKVVLLLESGIRIHVTAFEWPKNMAPSGFSMKMRKHIKNKRLEKLTQVGMDRIVDLQFGSGEAAYHVILELYDKGNIVFTDHEYTILNLLRPHTEGDAIRFAVREKYPVDRGKERTGAPSEEFFNGILLTAKPDESLKKILNPQLVYGPAIIEHCLLCVGLSPGAKLRDVDSKDALSKMKDAFQIAETIVDEASSKNLRGYIIQNKIIRPKEGDELVTNEEFHPMIFEQHKTKPYIEFANFNEAVDEFFSKMESQKIDLRGVQQEKWALKKLDNVKKDHEHRLLNLEKSQLEDTIKAELIERNQELVDDAIMAIRQAIASQMSWTDVDNLVKEAKKNGDPVASVIKHLKLKINHIALLLLYVLLVKCALMCPRFLDPRETYGNNPNAVSRRDPYKECNDEGELLLKPALVDIDLDLSAYANAKKYYDKKRQAATKQKKTLESQDKAFKSAEKKTIQTLKEVKTGITISKARKVFWFEKFFWFISSENYLVIGGRDQQQNELIVKRYLKTNDIYVHAGIRGASSVIIKNPKSDPIPPKTLNEAGAMAMCYSTAWEAKVVTSAWWVNANQVSKTAPTGEYLTTGSFMIRGKKNFLPQCHLIMGFTFLFKLEDSSIERHIDERKKKDAGESSEANTSYIENEDDVELHVSDGEDDNSDADDANNLSTIDENQELSFPDTEVLVEHGKDESRIKVKISNPEANTETDPSHVIDDEDEYIVYLGDETPVVIKPSNTNVKPEKKVHFQTSQPQQIMKTDQNKEGQAQKQKRGQKSKLKKIKEKYKDQDDEERKLRMKILQGCPEIKEKKIKKKDKKGRTNVALKMGPMKKKAVHVELLSVDDDIESVKNETVQNNLVDVDHEQDEEREDITEMTAITDVDMLQSLTGQPLPEDELLFAIPVVAPYNSIINYKYKVKLTPGTGKRGKSAKTALNVFLKDRTATPRERDLLKFVKDQDLARNFPGKVKISAPQLNKHK